MIQLLYRVKRLCHHWASAVFAPVLILGLILLFSNARLNAQELGGLTGTVADPTGAGIPGAHVTFREEATGVLTQVGTTSSGTYTATLNPGRYRLTVEAPGFQKYVQTGVVIEIGVTPTVNIQLTVGASSQTVHVASNAIALNTTQPQLGTMLTPKEVSDLPIEINNSIRQISSFATLAPGVSAGTGANPYNLQIDGGAVAGATHLAGVYFNGIPMPVVVQGFQTDLSPPYEMVNEFRVLRSTFSARYGLAEGAVSFNTRSGTNHLHGDGFYIDRNSVFDSVGFFPTAFNSSGKPIAPPDQESNFGGTVGGPVVLPKLYNGKNRTFFLGSVDLYYKTNAETKIGTVPTPAMKTGDFSHFVNAAGQQIPIYDPTTGKPFPGNIIPATRINPLSKSLLPLIPNPNSAGTVFGLENNETPAIPSEPLDTLAWGLTLDHKISPSQNVRFAWWRHNHSYVFPASAPIVPATNELTSVKRGVDTGDAYLFNYAKTVTPNLVATAGLAVETVYGNINNNDQNVNFSAVQNGTTFPGVSFDGQNVPTGYGVPGGYIQSLSKMLGYNAVNNWLWTRGRHTVNIGGEYRDNYELELDATAAGGAFNFSQEQTSTPNSSDPNFKTYGSSFASFLLGEAGSANRTSKNSVYDTTRDVSSYVMDNIKINPKLTVNAGLRWDIMIPYTVSHNQNVFINEAALNPGAANLPGAATMFGHCLGCAGYDRAAIHWGDFGPHLGFAYSLTDKTVIQGGAYITYLPGGAYDGETGGTNNSNGAFVNMSSLLTGEFKRNPTNSNVPGYGNWATQSMPSPAATPFNPSMGNGLDIYYFNPNTAGEAPYYQAWNLNLQRQLPWDMFLSVAYVGNRVIHLPSGMNPVNQPDPSILQYGSLLTQKINSPAAKKAGFTSPYPAFASEFGPGATVFQALKPFAQYGFVNQDFDMSGTSFYNAMQAQAEKRFSNGLSYLANLTLPSLYTNVNTSGKLNAPLNKYNQAPEYVQRAERYSVKIAATYLLPIGVGQKWFNSGVPAKVFGGWEMTFIGRYKDSAPLEVTQTGSGLNGFNRPNVVPGVKMGSRGYNLVKDYFIGKLPAPPVMFTTNAFANTGSQFVLGNAARSYSPLRGPAYQQEDIGIMKLFHIKDNVLATVRMDYFNAFNRHIFNGPITDISSPNFGKVISENGGGNRQGQISARVRF